jgi:hypothetical protein
VPFTLPYLKALLSRRLAGFDFPLLQCEGCDSKANLTDESEASPQLGENFPSTNQRADSFSPPGVNLEAKV